MLIRKQGLDNSSIPQNSVQIKRQCGFSMIELLVTILVFAVGLLGVASLQTTGMRLVRDANLMSHASMLASSMADKMRGNMIAGGSYSGVDGTDDSCLDLGSTPPVPTCTVEQEDLMDWNEQIESFLPGGSGSVTTAAEIHTISVVWTESQDSDQTDSLRTYDLVVRI